MAGIQIQIQIPMEMEIVTINYYAAGATARATRTTVIRVARPTPVRARLLEPLPRRCDPLKPAEG